MAVTDATVAVVVVFVVVVVTNGDPAW